MFQEIQQETPAVVTEGDLVGLPEPVQQWLRFSGIIGREQAVTVKLTQEGQFRRSPDGKWMPFTATQYYTTPQPAFLWQAKIRMAPLLPLKVRDKYMHGQGHMLGKLLGLFPVVDASGPKLDQATLLRYLNEIMWFPSAALADYISWEAIGDSSAKATMKYGGVEASAVFYYNEKGAIVNMVADRYREVNGEFRLDQWSTPISAYRQFNGVTVPSEGQGVWNLSSGDFAYIKLEITSLEYNVSLEQF